MKIKRKSWRSSHLCAIIVLAALACTVLPVSAAEYVLIPIGDLDPNDQEIICFGLNNHGEVVGRRLGPGGDVTPEAVVWLPKAVYSAPSAGLYSIDSIFTFNNTATAAGDGTVAVDINDAGVAVGRFHDGPNLYAKVWDISTAWQGTQSPLLLSNRFWAFSINNDPTPKVVGGTGELFEGRMITAEPSPPQLGSASYILSYNINQPSSSVLNALSLPPDLAGTAYGVSDTLAADVRVAGIKSCNLTPPVLCADPNGCGDPTDGAYWNNTSTAALELEADEENPPLPAETAFILGRAVNDNGVIVGFGHDPDDTTSCRNFGYVWRNGPSDPPDRLPLYLSGSGHTEMALDIRDQIETGDIQWEVVGRNTTVGIALLWRYDVKTADWTPHDLNTMVEDLYDFDALEAATAINDDGWVVAWGEQMSGRARSAVLVPCDEYRDFGFCPADIVGDNLDCPNGVVNVFDLLKLLNEWGATGSIADVDDDGIVNVFDLLDLLAAWGDCAQLPDQTVQSHEDIVIRAGLTMNDWNEFEDVMLYSSDEDEKDNYRCWMKRYLAACAICPTCPDADPFQ